MNWLSIVRYIVSRTREPSTVHRAVAAIGGLAAAFSLSGPEKWVALIVGGSALIGILLPDSETGKMIEVQSSTGVPIGSIETGEPESGFADKTAEAPPIVLVGRPAIENYDLPESVPIDRRAGVADDRLRPAVPADRRHQQGRSSNVDSEPRDSGWNG